MRRVLVGGLLFLLAACGGSEGATGPQGPAGPGTYKFYTAAITSSGSGGVQLPAAAGTSPDSPPVVTCYITNDVSSGTWLVVAEQPSTSGFPSCGVTFQNGTFAVAIINATPGWTGGFAVVY
jgi:hypothetical protein